MTAAPYAVVPAEGGVPYIAFLTDVQAAGEACTRCQATDVPMTPDGRCYPPGSAVESGGVQVFRCSSRCGVEELIWAIGSHPGWRPYPSCTAEAVSPRSQGTDVR